MGDLIVTTPLFRELKKLYPDSICTAVVQRPVKDLLNTNPHVDRVLTVPVIAGKWLPALIRRLPATMWFCASHGSELHADIAIVPRWDVDWYYATLLTALSNAPVSIGYSESANKKKAQLNKGFGKTFSICLPAGPLQHEVERTLAIIPALGGVVYNTTPEIYLTESDERFASELLSTIPTAERLVALGIGARKPNRRWPLERFAETFCGLASELPVRPVIIYAASEQEQAAMLARLLKADPILACRPIRQACAVLKRCELFVGNDSGPAHLAAAMGCRTIVVSPHPLGGDPNHDNSPIRFSPVFKQRRVLQPPFGLGRCGASCISHYAHCITAVTSTEVIAASLEMLADKQVAKSATAQCLTH
jgi:heptosyltransferase-2